MSSCSIQVDRLESHVLSVVLAIVPAVISITITTTTSSTRPAASVRPPPIVLLESVVLREPADSNPTGYVLRLGVLRVERQDFWRKR